MQSPATTRLVIPTTAVASPPTHRRREPTPQDRPGLRQRQRAARLQLLGRLDLFATNLREAHTALGQAVRF